MFRLLRAKKDFSKVISATCKILLSILIVVSIFAKTASASNYGGTLTIAYKDEPTSLNPLIDSSTISATINDVIFDGLVTLTPSGKILPRVAERWTVSEDGLTWLFYLNKKIKFHDGVKLTADDVEFTYTTVLKDKNLKWRTVFKNVESISKIDNYTIKVSLKSPGENFLFGFYFVGVLPKHMLAGAPYENEKFNRRPVGTGPFKFESWESNKRIMLTANKNYFKGRPNLDHIKLLRIPESTDIWKQLELGKIDTSYNPMTYEDYKVLKRSKIISFYRIQDNMNYSIIFNFKKKVFQEKKMRMALNSAIDRKEIIEKALGGNGIECDGVFSPSLFNKASSNEYNPEISVKLLHEMGYADTDGDGILERNGKKLSFNVIYDINNATKKDVLLIVQKQLYGIGIEMTVTELPVQDIFSRVITGNYEMIFSNFTTLLDMPILSWHSDSIRTGYNISNYRNKDIDKLFEQLISVRDKKRRKEIMNSIQKHVQDDVAGIFLYTPYNLVPMNKRVRGFAYDSDQFIWEMARTFYISSKK